VHLVTDDLGQTQDLDKMCDLGGGAEDDAGRRTHFFQQQRGYFTEFVLSSSCHEPSFSVPQRRSSSSLSGMMSRAPFFSGIWSRPTTLPSRTDTAAAPFHFSRVSSPDNARSTSQPWSPFVSEAAATNRGSAAGSPTSR